MACPGRHRMVGVIHANVHGPQQVWGEIAREVFVERDLVVACGLGFGAYRRGLN